MLQDWLHSMLQAERDRQLSSSAQARLGDLTHALEGIKDQSLPVVFDFGLNPTTLDSWRGIYAELALGYGTSEPPTVAALLAECRAADGETFQGWKGGDYTMERDTPLWVANPGETNGDTAIVGLRVGDGGVVIETANLSPYPEFDE